MQGFPILSIMLAIPAVAALVCLFLDARGARWLALGATLLDLALGVVLWANFDIGGARWQFQASHALFGGFGWMLGTDCFALLLIRCSVFLMTFCSEKGRASCEGGGC